MGGSRGGLRMIRGGLFCREAVVEPAEVVAADGERVVVAWVERSQLTRW